MSAGQFRRFVLAFLALLFSACQQAPPKKPSSDVDLIRHIRRSTATFVRPEDNHFSAYGAGVWLDDRHILTAYHCIGVPDQKDGVGPVDDLTIGTIMRYKTYSEVMSSPDVGRFVYDGHESKVVAFDKNADLALVQASRYVDHDFADVAPDSSVDGEIVHIVGHPRGDTYTYVNGLVSAIRLKPNTFGPPSVLMYQVSAPTWHGNSGGGVFNGNGELIGIMVMMETVDMDVGWAIHDLRIRQFLSDRRTWAGR